MLWLLCSPEKSPHCPWYRRLNGPQKWFGSFEKGKKLLTLPGFEPHFIKPTAWPNYTDYTIMAALCTK
jgi:hypothetical protein